MIPAGRNSTRWVEVSLRLVWFPSNSYTILHRNYFCNTYIDDKGSEVKCMIFSMESSFPGMQILVKLLFNEMYISTVVETPVLNWKD